MKEKRLNSSVRSYHQCIRLAWWIGVYGRNSLGDRMRCWMIRRNCLIATSSRRHLTVCIIVVIKRRRVVLIAVRIWSILVSRQLDYQRRYQRYIIIKICSRRLCTRRHRRNNRCMNWDSIIISMRSEKSSCKNISVSRID